MNWKKPSSDFLIYAGVQLAVLTLSFWKSFPHFRLYDFRSPEFTECALGAIAGSLGAVGCGILNREGARKVRRIVLFCFMGLVLILCTLVARGGQTNGWFYALLVSLAAPFPLALYLCRKQDHSTSQSKTDNAS
jgi:peptidoglycan/LPS O-acetylase OafA/YrhL